MNVGYMFLFLVPISTRAPNPEPRTPSQKQKPPFGG